jgi:hypothetical protein
MEKNPKSFYYKKALKIQEYLNERLNSIYGEGKMITKVYFKKQFCDCGNDESKRYLYPNRFEIEVEKYVFDNEISMDIPIFGSSFDVPLSVTNEKALRLVEETINDFDKII